MPILNLCPDPIIKTLRSVFQANIVRIPESRIQPMTTIIRNGKKKRFWGELSAMVEGDLLQSNEAIETSKMADVSGKQSKSVDLELGLQIMDGFLKGFSLPSAGIQSQFAGAKTVSFSFKAVERKYIQPAVLGGLLTGHALDASNTANDNFFNRQADLLIIDSIVTSSDFSINVEQSNIKDFKLDIPAIQKVIGKANTKIKVESTTGLDITFKGEEALTFAFTCLQSKIDPAGRISLSPANNFKEVFRGLRADYEKELLSEEIGLIEWD